MASTVLQFPEPASFKARPDLVLKHASEADLDGIIVIGRDKSGNLYARSSIDDAGDLFWLIELTKQHLMRLA